MAIVGCLDISAKCYAPLEYVQEATSKLDEASTAPGLETVSVLVCELVSTFWIPWCMSYDTRKDRRRYLSLWR